MWIKRVQLGLLHTAVAITLVPFTSTLNRVLIYEMGLAATLVTFLVALPYLISPIQVAIGSYADRHPIFGLRRTPYIALGLVLCVAGTFFTPQVVGLIGVEGWSPQTLLLAALAFGAWGMGYNFASVSYLSLATELDEKGRGQTIAVMFFMMILGIIATAITVSRLVDPYSLDALRRAFWTVGGIALVIGVLGLIRLEPRSATDRLEERYSWGQMFAEVTSNPQARLFFVYLVILLAALLGQDVLLEPFGAETLNLSVEQTTRITSIWGTTMLVALLAAGWLQARISKRTVAAVGAWGALLGFVSIAATGLIPSSGLFYSGVVILGFGTGLSTVSNLSLMLDMTTPENVGLFIGAWGMANAVSRLIGQMMSGVVRDGVTLLIDNAVLGYVVVFVIEAAFLGVSLLILRRIDVSAFKSVSEPRPVSLIEQAALMSEAGGD